MIIHLHFHRRATGVTRSVESIVPLLSRYDEAGVFGYGIVAQKRSLVYLLRAVFSGKRSVIHAHRNNELLFALLLRMVGGSFLLVFTRHSDTMPARFTLFLMKRADRIVSLNRGMLEILPFPSTLIRHGVNTEVFNPGTKTTLPGIRQENLITVIGRIRPEKGQITIMKAVSPLLKGHNTWGVILIGRTDHKDYLNEILSVAAEEGVSEQVHIIPETDNILKYYHASRVVVIASRSEGFSLVCLEAMACGLVTIATEGVGIHAEAIRHGLNGFLFPPDDVDALAEILSGVMNNRLALDPLIIRKSVSDSWSTDKSVNELLKVYQIENESE